MKFTTSLVAAATLLTTALGAPTTIPARDDTQATWTITNFVISSEFPKTSYQAFLTLFRQHRQSLLKI